MSYTRRQMVQFLSGVAAFLYGKPEKAQINIGQYAQMNRAAPSRIVLVLDGTDGVEVVYRGERITVPPQEVMDALRRK